MNGALMCVKFVHVFQLNRYRGGGVVSGRHALGGLKQSVIGVPLVFTHSVMSCHVMSECDWCASFLHA